MKKSNLIKSFFFVTLLGAGLTSCGSDDGGGTSRENLAVTANGSGLTTFVAAAELAGVGGRLTANNDHTVFAPTNAAFDQFLSENGFANINAVPVELLKEVVLNHIMTGDVAASALATGYRKTLAHGPASASATLSLYVKTESAVKLNGVSTITTSDVRASNGRIHIVDKVIPLATVFAHIQANSDLSMFTAALQTNPASQFVQTLSGTGNQSPFTVLAPVNAGVNTLLNDLDVDGFGDLSAAALEELLSYHILGGTNLSYTQIADGTYTTLSGQSFTVLNTGGGKKITDVSNRIANFGNNTTRDIQAWNGVIHLIDNGLKPGL
ncbi:fasciclin domain-containing protein [Flavobacterium selenitireducens]|uniref:fasciclin domain-containing protein n=1 Tax=Flavobacterium selenitireducens TaxID=2722704 RepID=UPI00168A8E69|nr:fasciclin domain-containing protein [Flavobacterium selenitireducens]MBD3583614.1 fasciclin domain-containing protein [Flavobacterium selenitireducens]